MWCPRACTEELPRARSRAGIVKPPSPATVGQVGGDSGEAPQESPERSAVIGTCPLVELEVGGVRVPCMLDTGSQVTMFSQSFFKKHFGDLPMRNSTEINWLSLTAANGLSIPYVGYILIHFSVGGVKLGNNCGR